MPSVHKKYVYTRSCRYFSIVFIIHLLNVTSSISIRVCECVSVFEYIKILHICARLKYTVGITIFDICIHVLLLHCIESKSSIYLQVIGDFSLSRFTILPRYYNSNSMRDLRKRCMAEKVTITNALPLSKESFLFWWKVGLLLSSLLYVYVYVYIKVCTKSSCGSGLLHQVMLSLHLYIYI